MFIETFSPVCHPEMISVFLGSERFIIINFWGLEIFWNSLINFFLKNVKYM
jgi:hypothetical protein